MKITTLKITLFTFLAFLSLALGKEEARNDKMYNDGQKFSKEIQDKMMKDQAILLNYLDGLKTTLEPQIIKNRINVLMAEEKRWKSNKYYYEQEWSEIKSNMYKESKGERKMIESAYKLKRHANEQAIICLNIQAKVMKKMLKTKMIKEELAFK